MHLLILIHLFIVIMYDNYLSNNLKYSIIFYSILIFRSMNSTEYAALELIDRIITQMDKDE